MRPDAAIPQAKLTRTIDRAVRFCLETQRVNGSWEVLSDPRIFDTALVAYALSLAGPSQRARDAVERARAWLRRAPEQHHAPLARTIEQAVCDVALGKRSPLDLSGLTEDGV